MKRKEKLLNGDDDCVRNFQSTLARIKREKAQFRSKNIILMSSTSIPKDKRGVGERASHGINLFQVGHGDKGHETKYRCKNRERGYLKCM